MDNKIRWEEVSWINENSEIAKELGVDKSKVAAMRAHYCPESLVPSNTIPWNTVDWTKSNGEIASELKFRKSRVSHARSIYAPHTLHAAHVDWATIDWSKSNEEIGKQLGRKEETVDYYRNRYSPTLEPQESVPGTGQRNLPLYKRMEVDIKGTYETGLAKWLLVDWTQSNKKIADQNGTLESTVKTCRSACLPYVGKGTVVRSIRLFRDIMFSAPDEVRRELYELIEDCHKEHYRKETVMPYKILGFEPQEKEEPKEGTCEPEEPKKQGLFRRIWVYLMGE